MGERRWVSEGGRYLTGARLQEEEWKVSALHCLIPPLCQFIQRQGDIINPLHATSVRHLMTTPGENRAERKTLVDSRFFDVLL